LPCIAPVCASGIDIWRECRELVTIRTVWFAREGFEDEFWQVSLDFETTCRKEAQKAQKTELQPRMEHGSNTDLKDKEPNGTASGSAIIRRRVGEWGSHEGTKGEKEFWRDSQDSGTNCRKEAQKAQKWSFSHGWTRSVNPNQMPIK
jgi:hypothetical protein